MKFLVVDDDPIVLDLVPMLLRQEGHTDISVAASGMGALDILSFSAENFEVLLLDIEMPGMNGIELCAEIRKIPAYRSTPIIMLTAKSDASSIESAFSAGANDYITKPFDIESIATRTHIAERMMRETCKVFTRDSLSDCLPGPFGQHDFDFAEPIVFNDLNHHTDPFSLGNYLSQLAQQRVTETSVFALKIDTFDLLYDELTGRDLLLIIAAVSNSISTATADNRLLNAYVGSGIFLCIAPDDLVDAWVEVEENISAILKELSPIRKAELLDTFSVTMGRPVRPYLSKTQRVRRTFDRAKVQLSRRLNANMVAN